mgnify:CR=1 FL=1
MSRRTGGALADVVLPVALTDPSLAARRERKWRRMGAGQSICMMGLLGVLTQIFLPSAKPVVFEQKVDSPGDPFDLTPDSDSRGRFAGRVTLRRAYP